MWREYLMRDETAWRSFHEWAEEREKTHAKLLSSTPIEDLPVLKGKAKELEEIIVYVNIPLRKEQENASRSTR